METGDRLRILIVGAGIGGLTAAAALRASGHQVRVVERAGALTAVGGHIGVQSNAVLALRRLGVDGPVVAAGEQVETFEMRSWSGRRLARWSPGAVGRELSAPSVTVPRSLVLASLAEAADGVPVRHGETLVGLAEAPDQVVAEMSSGHRIAADVVIGADGLRSTVRRQLKLPGHVRYVGYTSWRGRAGIRPGDLGAGVATHYLSHSRTVGCWPLPGGGTYWVATHRQAEPAADSDPARLADGRPLPSGFADAPAPVLELIRHTPAAELLRTPIYVLDGAADWHTRRVVMLGDAVHAMEPTTGQGAAQAMLDALALAGQLTGLAGGCPADQVEAAFRRYVEVRREPVTAIAREASGVGRMHHVGGPTRGLLRDAVLRATPQRVWQRRAALRLTDARLLELPVAAADGERR